MPHTRGKCGNLKGCTAANSCRVINVPLGTSFVCPECGEGLKPLITRLRIPLPTAFVVFLALQLAFFGCVAWTLTSRPGTRPVVVSRVVASTTPDAIVVEAAAGHSGSLAPTQELHKHHGTGDFQPRRDAEEKRHTVSKRLSEPEPPTVIAIGTNRTAISPAGPAENIRAGGLARNRVVPTSGDEIEPPAVSELLAHAPAPAQQAPPWVVDGPVSMPAEPLLVSSGTTGGQIVRRVMPIYPEQARARGIQGTVVLEITIGEDGAVHKATVLSGPPPLANAAQLAVQQWRYTPIELNGKPVPITSRITLHFTLP